MSKALRLSEKWFRRGLWLVAVVFACFLIGLGGVIVDDLPRVETPLHLDDFLDRSQAAALRAKIDDAQQVEHQAQAALEQAQLVWDRARGESQASRETFENWLATRSVTQQAENDPELIARTRALDTLKDIERRAQQAVDAQRQALLDARQAADAATRQLETMRLDAREQFQAELHKAELRVFLYRLALTLPLLVVAGWLFARKRKSTYWPFVWGFIYFALFAFFIELVPYLPSYGGYVRYTVGIIVTILAGYAAIRGLERYLERQRQAEALPEDERRRGLGYDAALARLSKSVCPGCERKVDLADGVTDFCPHCGIGLYVSCGYCGARKSAFTRFCPQCGKNDQRT